MIAMPAAPAPEVTTRISSSFSVCELQRVEEGGQDDDGRTVLIVVKDRDVAFLLEPAFDLKAARRGDIFQVDAAEAARQERYRFDDLHLHPWTGCTEGPHPTPPKALNSTHLPSMTGIPGLRADIAEAREPLSRR